jgi:hypothetical protein
MLKKLLYPTSASNMELCRYGWTASRVPQKILSHIEVLYPMHHHLILNLNCCLNKYAFSIWLRLSLSVASLSWFAVRSVPNWQLQEKFPHSFPFAKKLTQQHPSAHGINICYGLFTTGRHIIRLHRTSFFFITTEFLKCQWVSLQWFET